MTHRIILTIIIIACSGLISLQQAFAISITIDDGGVHPLKFPENAAPRPSTTPEMRYREVERELLQAAANEAQMKTPTEETAKDNKSSSPPAAADTSNDNSVFGTVGGLGNVGGIGNVGR